MYIVAHLFTEYFLGMEKGSALKGKGKQWWQRENTGQEKAHTFCAVGQYSNLILSFPELKSLGADFTFGFIQVMDGEKDPRNLLVAFRIVHDLISRDYSLGTSW